MHKNRYRLASRPCISFLFLAIFLVACSGTSTSHTLQPSVATTPALTSSPAQPDAPPPPVPATCAPSRFLPGNETQAQGVNAEVWALFFADPQTIKVGDEVKIVWRMTGNGPFQAIARHAGNVELKPVWGPEKHLGSNWKHPGEEWGTGFRFTAPGCWNLHVTRDHAAGDLWISVQEAGKGAYSMVY
uniref:YtkA-like domain-containing protein n=1 Tax=Thermosporothrix sp. COM3 TaxID=2490863 RepID=A0A455SDY6_9CHLR|nr:hypothetical protein KTC_03090 [Thermosporothrix sp. COM3]